METALKLSEQEHHCYRDMFNSLDVDGCGVLTGAHVSDFFMTSGLPPEIIHQIIELCGAKRVGRFGRSQFFIALKLIAAAQNGFPVALEVCQSGFELPLPRFAMQFNADLWRSRVVNTAYTQPVSLDPRVVFYDRNILVHPLPQPMSAPKGARSYPAPPRSLSLAITTEPQQLYDQAVDLSPTSPRPDASNRKQSAPVLSHVVSNASAAGEIYSAHQFAGGPSDHKADKGWASFEDDYQASAHNPEHTEWTQFSDVSNKADTSSMSSDGTEDVWTITDEQHEYYINQFKTMQEDVRGIISGTVAKEFFEKSKLPVMELSKIWQLSDVNRDGALSLEEFCTAMHLVVLRRNDIELPDTLPPALLPYTPLINSDESYAVDLPPDMAVKKHSPTSSISSQQWTTAFPLPESPTSSSVSSPGNKPTPVNFEFRPITADPDSKIVHPVALRMSPDGQPYSLDAAASLYPEGGAFLSSTDHQGGEDVVSPGVVPVATDLLIDIGVDSTIITSQPHSIQQLTGLIQGRPRPTPKKAQSLPGPAAEVRVQRLPPPPPSQEAFTGDRTTVLVPTQVPSSSEGVPPPPPPPPRTTASHSRSSSIDDQLIDLSDEGESCFKLPPVVPPRLSPKEKSIGSPGVANIDRRGSRDDIDVPFKTSGVSKHSSLERRDLLASIRNQKERNMVLSRLNGELNQELQEAMEQRIALEIQMEHLQG